MEDTTTQTFCHNHPTVETALRCNKCGEYICAKCAVRTPTGYSCKSCIKNQQKVFDNSNTFDCVLTVAVAGALSFIGSLVLIFASSLFFGMAGVLVAIFLPPLAGIVIGEAIRLVTGKRRSEKVFKMALIATVIGALPLFVYQLLITLLSLSQNAVAGIWSFLDVIYLGYYAAIASTSTYYRVSGKTIRFRR